MEDKCTWLICFYTRALCGAMSQLSVFVVGKSGSCQAKTSNDLDPSGVEPNC